MRFLKLFPVFAFAALISISACQQAQDADTAAEAVDDAATEVEGMADDAMDAMDEMGDDAMDAAHDAVDDAEGVVDDAMDEENPCSPDADAANPCEGE